MPTRLLPARRAWTAGHPGPHDILRDTTRAILHHVETLLKGNDCCTPVITLPVGAV